MDARDCPYHEDEVAFVAAIPRELIYEMLFTNSDPERTLLQLLQGAPFLWHHAVVRSPKCFHMMSDRLMETRWFEAPHLPLGSLIELVNTQSTDFHVEICRLCTKKREWLKRVLEFRLPYESAAKDAEKPLEAKIVNRFTDRELKELKRRSAIDLTSDPYPNEFPKR